MFANVQNRKGLNVFGERSKQPPSRVPVNLGRNAVEYEAAPGTGVCFRSELWHRTERASEGTMKVTLFFGRWLK